MHELGLLRSVADAVTAAAERAGATGVQAVGLRVGTLSGAVPEALTGAWPIAVAGTVVAGARLELEVVPATVWCPHCGTDQPIDEFFALTCPVCDTPTGNLSHGREFEVTWADLDIDRPDDDPVGSDPVDSGPLGPGPLDSGPPDTDPLDTRMPGEDAAAGPDAHTGGTDHRSRPLRGSTATGPGSASPD
ncbi:hydrogenase maturation nickel metallochaperone HypA [Raineyella sp.]|uniref:hydrogenase maturation nickel metallochaperone HypA/HybF n=1 Tax=Raineyella sp. TaxID=1911550 RepID=UPI002B1F3E58|nr:hydrogenase maturation nickel metallochaperone HypA [Raineyella sp.]MEA5153747.1 hydrogenase maturation nickel metallochaperone HypA [Raineyella sp.]